jgi:competence protein ComEA
MGGPIPPWRSIDGAAIPDEPAADASVSGASPGLVVLGTLAVISVSIAATIVVWSMSGTSADEGPVGLADPSTGDTSAGAAVMVVEVEGAVSRPGVYRLPEGSRIADAVAAAGGYSPRVDVVSAEREINLAAVLHDGDRVAVPSRDIPPNSAQTDVGAGGGSVAGGSQGLVSLNVADQAALEALPGIGPVTAAKIITARQEQPFGAVEDLLERKVVGKATFERIRDLVTVGG